MPHEEAIDADYVYIFWLVQRIVVPLQHHLQLMIMNIGDQAPEILGKDEQILNK
jgi:hypothetical protein